MSHPRPQRPPERLAPEVTEEYLSGGETGSALPRSVPAKRELVAVPGYEILEELGRGGMGVVYKARQTGLGRLVALKMILSGEHAGATERERFRAEAAAAAQLQHPGIVQVYEVGESGGRLYFSLEYVDGGSLASRLDGTPLLPRRAAELVAELARAVQYAHDHGIVHRDLKPANVLLAQSGVVSGGVVSGKEPPTTHHSPLTTHQPKITDFGLAKHLDSAGHTQTGAILGTPSYMAPEQASGRSREVGPAADIYALGAILYELLTGRPPFKAATPLDTVLQVVRQEPVPPSRFLPKLGREVETICLKCLEKDPRKRYGSAASLANDLAAFLDGRPIAARPIGRLGRFIKLVRRRPLTTALVTGIFVSLGLGLGVALWQLRQTEAARDGETRALREAETNIYRINFAFAEREWLANRTARAEELLNQCRSELRNWEWHYLRRQMEGGLLRIPATNASAGGELLMSRDGRRLVVQRLGGLAIIDISSGKTVGNLDAAKLRAEGASSAVALSPDGEVLALIGQDYGVDFSAGGNADPLRRSKIIQEQIAKGLVQIELRLVAIGTGKEVWRIRRPGIYLTQVSFSPSGRRIAGVVASGQYRLGADADDRLIVWDAATGEEMLNLAADRQAFARVTFSPDDQRIAFEDAHSVRLLDANSGEVVAARIGDMFRRRTGDVAGLMFDASLSAFNADGSRFAALVVGPREWVTVAGLVRVLPGFVSVGPSLAMADGVARAGLQQLSRSTTAEQMEVVVWDTRSGTEQYSLQGYRGWLKALRFTPDGNWLVTVGSDQFARFWDVKTGIGARFYPGVVGEICFTADGQRFAAAGPDHAVRLWDLSAGREVHTLRGHRGPVLRVAFADADRRLVTLAERPRKKLTLPTNPGELNLERIQELQAKLAKEDPEYFLHHELIVWDTRGQEGLTVVGPAGPARAVTFGSDGTPIVLSGDKELAAWRVTAAGPESLVALVSRENLAPRPGLPVVAPTPALGASPGAVPPVTLSGDGRIAAAVGIDGSVRLWLTATGNELPKLVVPGGARGVALTADGSRVAIATGSGYVVLSDATTGKELAIFPGPVPPTDHRLAQIVRPGSDGIPPLAFAPDGRLALAIGTTVEVRGTDPVTVAIRLEGHSAEVTGLAFSADSRLLATGARDGSVKVWDARTGEVRASFPAHLVAVTCLAFTSDGSRLVSGGPDGTLKVWDAATGHEFLTLKGHEKGLTGVALSPDGHRLISVSVDGSVRVWDATPLNSER